MNKSLLHTPEGVRDIYNQECEKKMYLQDNLQKLLMQYGYRAIQTPTFEFFDIFSSKIGTTPAKDLYKFFDREGNTLVLRPDITPSIARSVTKYFAQEDMPIRLWYQGNTFINNNSYQGRLKESTQLGAELIGDDSVDADAEIITLMVNALRTAGLSEFQISIGHVDFLKGLVQEAKLDSETTEELQELISNKNFFGVEELVAPIEMDANLRTLFSALGNIYNDEEELEECRCLAADYPTIRNALDRLIDLYHMIRLYQVEDHVTMELGIISSYKYYTGIIFAGYTFGSGEAIVKGGRYDDLLPYFGKNAPSIGFAVVIDQLMAALSRQKIPVPVQHRCRLVVYDKEKRSDAIAYARGQRAIGQKIMLICKDPKKTSAEYEAYASRCGCAETVFFG